MDEYSPEDELRHGVAESLARLGIKIVSSKPRGVACIKLGNRKPSLRVLANEMHRSKQEHENIIAQLQVTIPAQTDDTVSSDDVDMKDLFGVLSLMRLSRIKKRYDACSVRHVSARRSIRDNHFHRVNILS